MLLLQLLVVLAEGWAGDYQRVIQRTSDAVESGQKTNHLLHNLIQMVTATQDNALWGHNPWPRLAWSWFLMLGTQLTCQWASVVWASPYLWQLQGVLLPRQVQVAATDGGQV